MNLHKPKLKPLLKRVMAFLVATATTLSLAVPAFAWTANSTGNAVTAVDNAPRIGIRGSNNLSWKLDYYVATSSNGKIDPVTDKIDESLVYIGSVLVNNFSSDIYIQTDHTNNRSNMGMLTGHITQMDNAGWSTSTGFTYRLPHVYLLKQDKNYYPTADGRTVYNVTNFDDLPSTYVGITKSTHEALVEQVLEDFEFQNNCLTEIRRRMGTQNFDKKVFSNLGDGPKAKSTEIIKKDPENWWQRLLPNEDPSFSVVEWCCVASPLLRYTELGNSNAFFEAMLYDTSTNSYKFEFMGNSKCSIALDAWGTAIYNEATAKLYGMPVYIQSAKNNGYGVVRDARYIEYKGKLSYECTDQSLWVNLSNNVANVLFDTHEVSSVNGYMFCGVQVLPEGRRGNLAQVSKDLCTPPDADTGIFRLAGGIAVILTEIAEPDIPVYYHVTYQPNPDPNNPPTGDKYTYKSEWKPSHEFEPDPDKVGDGEVIQIIFDDEPDTPMYPDPDTKHNKHTTPNIPDPVPVPEPEPKEIHVWVNKPPQIPVYLHTYTYTLAEDEEIPEDICEWLEDKNARYKVGIEKIIRSVQIN